MKVIISNGTKNFHLTNAASQVAKCNSLMRLLNGAYPTAATIKFSSCIPGLANRVPRLAARRVDLPDNLVDQFIVADLVNDIGVTLSGNSHFQRIGGWLEKLSMLIFSQSARRAISNLSSNPDIYHYRAGFGLCSLKAAKNRGAILICDHSIAHPNILASLVSNREKLHPETEKKDLAGFWPLVLRDIEQADFIVVNSEFVKETFEAAGAKTDNVFVIYNGIDNNFLSYLPEISKHSLNGPMKILFAGAVSERKGARALIAAISNLPKDGWELAIAGYIEPEFRTLVSTLLSNDRVKYLGALSRQQLAEQMSASDVFLFPSLAEGSARVVFEALAAGCYVITTKNSGSIVTDEIHGKIVPPNDADAIVDAIKFAIGRREHVSEIGLRNSELVRKRYTQEAYGESMMRLYRELQSKHSQNNASNE